PSIKTKSLPSCPPSRISTSPGANVLASRPPQNSRISAIRPSSPTGRHLCAIPARRVKPLRPAAAAGSVVVARHAVGLRHLLELDRRLQHHAVAKLVGHAALDFLPRRLARRHLEAARGVE